MERKLISLSVAVEPVGGQRLLCDAWPVRRQTYGYLPGLRASPPFGRYQIVLLGDRGTWVLTTCPELLPDGDGDVSRESNPRPIDLESDTLTTTPPSHPPTFH